MVTDVCSDVFYFFDGHIDIIFFSYRRDWGILICVIDRKLLHARAVSNANAILIIILYNILLRSDPRAELEKKKLYVHDDAYARVNVLISFSGRFRCPHM